jgi:hypothetical protein
MERNRLRRSRILIYVVGMLGLLGGAHVTEPRVVAAAEVTGEAKQYGDTRQQCCDSLERMYTSLEGRGYGICLDTTGRDTYIRGTARWSGYCTPHENRRGGHRYFCVAPVTVQCTEARRVQGR